LLAVFCWISATVANPDGWKLLYEGKLDEAQAAFYQQTSDPFSDSAYASALRGLVELYDLRGQEDAAAETLLKAFAADENQMFFAANLITLYSQQYDGNEAIRSDIIKVLRKLVSQQTVFSGFYADPLLSIYHARGKITTAKKLSDRMRYIRSFKIIGPFDNLGGSGVTKPTSIDSVTDFSKSYPGIGRNETRWHSYTNESALPWLFLDKYNLRSNAYYYLYTTVEIDEQFNGYAALGFSGSFQLFVNDQLVAQEEKYKHTAMDMVMVPVHLKPGSNRLLVKIGHESLSQRQGGLGYVSSNITMRLVDSLYAPLQKLRIDPTVALSYDTVRTDSVSSVENFYTVSDTLVNYFSARLQADSGDFEALSYLIKSYFVRYQTDSIAALIDTYEQKYPQASLLYWYKVKNLLVAGKTTEARATRRKLYESIPQAYAAWSQEFNTIAENGSCESGLEFVAKAPEHLHSKVDVLLYQIVCLSNLGKEDEALALIPSIEQHAERNAMAAMFIARIYANQGNTYGATKALQGYLKDNAYHYSMWGELANLWFNDGKQQSGLKALQSAQDYNPMVAELPFMYGRIKHQLGSYSSAVDALKRADQLMPDNEEIRTYMANILNSRGKKTQAKNLLKDAITYSVDNVNSWELLREIEGKQPLRDILPLVNTDSLIAEADTWENKGSKNGAFVWYSKDIFVYPNRTNFERVSVIISVATQSAIDTWKHITIPYNSNFERISILKAEVVDPAGSKSNPEITGNNVVFTGLKPGSYIVLQWDEKNYYSGMLSAHVYGSMNFVRAYPTKNIVFNIVHPSQDSIPYRLYSERIKKSNRTVGDFTITSFASEFDVELQKETYRPGLWKGMPRVVYSTLSNWNQIAGWYNDLVQNKISKDIAITSIAQQLSEGAKTKKEKLKNLHEFMSTTIRYSYLNFRQSGIVPQPAVETLSSRLGDCKDMATLAKALLDNMGIESNIVLVNTDKKGQWQDEYIGINFDHAILRVTLDTTDHFIDFTDYNQHLFGLPVMDQASMALIVADSTTQPFILPRDSVESRAVHRMSKTVISENGDIKRRVATRRVGAYATAFRHSYRDATESDRNATMHNAISPQYPTVELESFEHESLDQLSDTVAYTYAFTAPSALQTMGSVISYNLNLSDKIDYSDYPSEKERITPVNFLSPLRSVGTFAQTDTLVFPSSWKLLEVPKPISVNSEFGDYTLSFRKKSATVLIVDRSLQVRANQIVYPDAYQSFVSFFSSVASADQVPIIFKK